MIEKCKKLFTFCVEHWKEIFVTSIGIHLLWHPWHIIQILAPILAWLGIK